MPAHKMLISQLLRNLGHPVPSDKELKDALQKAFHDIKVKDGVDPDKVKYKLSLSPVTHDWVKETFG